MIRVIHYLPSINCTSGITNLIMNYYKNIDKNKIQFHFVYFTEKGSSNFENEIISLGGTATYILPPNKYNVYKREFSNYLNDFKEKYCNDDIIFHNHQLAFTIFQYNLLKKFNISNIIIHNHMTKFSDKRFSSIRNCLLFLPVMFFKVKYMACSDDAAKIIFKYNMKRKNDVFVLNNCIDTQKYSFNNEERKKVRKTFGISEQDFLIGHIGHFESVKNHDFIYEIYSELFKKDKTFKLILIGNGSKKEYYLKKFKEITINNNIIILESRRDIPQLLSAMDCFVFPSKFEGLGIAAVEAQSTGLPVITSKSVPKDVVIKNCYQIDTKTPEEWIKKIEIIRNQKINREKTKEYVEKSKFNVFNNIELLEDYYTKLV